MILKLAHNVHHSQGNRSSALPTEGWDNAWGSVAPRFGAGLPCPGARIRRVKISNALSTAGNSMTSTERPSPEPLLTKEKEKRPQPYWGRDNSGNALEALNALNYRAWGIPAVLSRGIPGNALRTFPGSFRNFYGISSGKSQPSGGCDL